MTKLSPKSVRRWIASSIALVSLTACNTLPVYDKEVCGDLGSDGAHCQHTYIDKARDIPKAEWDQMRVGYMCMDSTAFTDTETALDLVCLRIRCDYRTREIIEQTKQKMHEVAEAALEARRQHK